MGIVERERECRAPNWSEKKSLKIYLEFIQFNQVWVTVGIEERERLTEERLETEGVVKKKSLRAKRNLTARYNRYNNNGGAN